MTDRRNEKAPSGHSGYREFRPPARLRDHVICFWHHQPRSDPSVSNVLPDGCVDILWVNERPPLVAGPMTLPLRSALEPGTEIVGVRFRPGVAQQVLGIDAKELLNQHVPLHNLWPRDRHLRWEEVAAGTGIAVRLAAISELVTRRVTTTEGADAFLTYAAAWLARHPRGRIDELSRLSGLGERQLRRRFDQAVGYGPKTLQRVMRLQYLLWLASRGEHVALGLARLALAAGYADQPHMTRELVALTGTPPRQLLVASAPQAAVATLFQASAPNQGVRFFQDLPFDAP